MPAADPHILRSPRRLEALHASGLLDAGAEVSFDRFTRVAARALDVPIALLSLVDAQRQFLKSAVGLAAGTSMPLARSFCQHVAAEARPLIIEDAATHPLVHDNLATLEDGVRAYAGVPVYAAGQALGAFCAVDHRPRAWSDRDLAMLKDLADSCADEIVVRLMRRRTAGRWET